jgi:putative Holliday junction resolvase
VKRILGLDLGEARTGVALSDELRMLAHPLETIESTSAERVARRIQKIVAERQVDCVVVGLPRRMNGALGLAAENAQRFVEKLRPLVPCEVVTWDERLSTVAAERALREAGKKTRQTRQFRDQVAAQIILQSYLDRLGEG